MSYGTSTAVNLGSTRINRLLSLDDVNSEVPVDWWELIIMKHHK